MKRICQLIMGTLLGIAMLAAVSCSSDLNNVYAPLHAFFRTSPVTGAPPLFRALNNPGIFCQVVVEAHTVRFSAPDGSGVNVPLIQIDRYARPMLVCGLLVGTPNLPGFNGNFESVVYDLACSNCYYQYTVNQPVHFAEHSSSQVKCPRCHRTYDLYTGGIVVAGEKGRPLFRYHYTYNKAGDAFTVQN